MIEIISADQAALPARDLDTQSDIVAASSTDVNLTQTQLSGIYSKDSTRGLCSAQQSDAELSSKPAETMGMPVVQPPNHTH